MTHLDSILKSRDVTLPTKVHLIKAMVLPVVMWKLDYKESWVLKNWCFWTVVLEKTLESPLDCTEILKEISPGCSWEGQMLKLKLQYSGYLMRRADSLEKTLMVGGIEGRRRRGRQRMRWLDGITDSMDVSLSELRWWTGRPGMLWFMGLQRVGHNWASELIWAEIPLVFFSNWCFSIFYLINFYHLN